MPLVTDYQEVKEAYQEAAELGVGLRVFCAEDRETLEAASVMRDASEKLFDENVKLTARYLERAKGHEVIEGAVDEVSYHGDRESQLRGFVEHGVLARSVLAADYRDTEPPIKPKLAQVANPPRRDAWFAAVRDRCREFLDILGYRKLGR